MLMHPIDYMQNKLPKCPHCGEDFEVWSGDNALILSYDDGGQTQFDCVSCRKTFTCVTHVHQTFSTAVSDDAADEEQWGPIQADAA